MRATMSSGLVPSLGGTLNTEDWPTEDEITDMAMADELAAQAISKSFSPAFGNRSRRRNQLVARLKQARNYPAPTRGGTGAQARTRRRKF